MLEAGPNTQTAKFKDKRGGSVLDFLQTRDVFMSLVGHAGMHNRLNAVERPINAYGPCWCTSGKKWKFCHKDREKQVRLSFGKMNAELSKYFSTGPCQHPDASLVNCSTPSSIQSHTIQRRGGLAAIAEDGHVYSTKKAFIEIDKRNGQIGMAKIGVGKASTFPGFCSRHDTELFRPVELAESKLDIYNGFLLSFRALTYELATKDAQLRFSIASKEFIDNGASFEHQAAIQNYLSIEQRGIEQGLAGVAALKEKYGESLLKNDLHGFSFFGVEFNGVFPFAVAGAFLPEFDFSGVQLQEIKNDSPQNHIALNITQLGDKTCVGFGWFGGPNCAAARLVQSFKSIPDDEKSNAVLVLALEHLENFFCKPSWWDGLAPDISARLHKKVAGGLPSRSPTALVEPELKAVRLGVLAILEV